MIEVVLNDRLWKKVRVKCNEDDTIGNLKKLVAYTIYKDHITLKDYKIQDGMASSSTTINSHLTSTSSDVAPCLPTA